MKRWKLAALAAGMLAWTPAFADQASALQAVKAQPRVVDAEVDTTGNMYVLVKNEAISWNQFAGAVCSLVRPHQGRIFRVRVVELTQAVRGKPPGSWTRMGEASCSN